MDCSFRPVLPGHVVLGWWGSKSEKRLVSRTEEATRRKMTNGWRKKASRKQRRVIPWRDRGHGTVFSILALTILLEVGERWTYSCADRIHCTEGGSLHVPLGYPHTRKNIIHNTINAYFLRPKKFNCTSCLHRYSLLHCPRLYT